MTGVRPVQGVRGWALASSVLAPVALIGGWTAAAARQPGNFDPVRDTISALAAHGATDRWLMTSALAITGGCHLLTAAGLPAAATAGRAVLAVGGVASIGVATFPQGVDAADNPAHAVSAGIAFGALTLWPVLATRARPGSWALTRRAGAGATMALTAALVWFGAELTGDGARLGASERVLAGAQALWPLVVVASAVGAARSRSGGSGSARTGSGQEVDQ